MVRQAKNACLGTHLGLFQTRVDENLIRQPEKGGLSLLSMGLAPQMQCNLLFRLHYTIFMIKFQVLIYLDVVPDTLGEPKQKLINPTVRRMEVMNPRVSTSSHRVHSTIYAYCGLHLGWHYKN